MLIEWVSSTFFDNIIIWLHSMRGAQAENKREKSNYKSTAEWELRFEEQTVRELDRYESNEMCD